MGSVYLRQGSKKYWIKYVQHGRVIRESTESKNIADARRMLKTREGDVVRGIPIDPEVGRITFEEAAADLLNDYAMNRKKTYDDARRRIRKHLEPYFGKAKFHRFVKDHAVHSDLAAVIELLRALRHHLGIP